MSGFLYKYGDRPLEGYTIQRAAGVGGFGEVYYAVSDSGRDVALKAIRRCEQIELRGISQCMNLKSPHLVTIFDVKYNDQKRPFVIMEYVSGPSLRHLLREAPGGLGSQKAAFFLREIAKGLSFLHDCGIVHRDLKPSNIFYENGYFKIGDYGLAKAITPGSDIGHTSTVGTVHYMAPELGTGQYDRTIDIYALGVVLYEMLTGRLPFSGPDRIEVFKKHLSSAPPVDGIEEPFARVILRAMAKDPRERYSTCQAMVEDVFDVEHIRNSVSQFSPDELSIVAARCRPKIRNAAPPAGTNQVSMDRANDPQSAEAEKVAKRTWMKRSKVLAVVAMLAIALAVGGYFGSPVYREYQARVLQSDIALAEKAAEAGNMKLVLDLIKKHPHSPELAGLRLAAFEKLRPTYGAISLAQSDRQLSRMINRRIKASGVMMWDLSPHKSKQLWSCIQVVTPDGDYRYLQLFFPEMMGTLEELEKQGLVKGARVEVYGFFTRVDRRFLKADQYGLNPVEAWFVTKVE